MLNSIEEGLNKCDSQVTRLKYPSLTVSVSLRIRRVWKKIEEKRDLNGILDAKEYKTALNTLESYSAEVDKIKSWFERLHNTALIMRFATKFIKNSLFIQAANLPIALILLPILIHYLSFLIPALHFSPQNIWHYQKVIMILGAISGLILASLLTRKDQTE